MILTIINNTDINTDNNTDTTATTTTTTANNSNNNNNNNNNKLETITNRSFTGEQNVALLFPV